MVTIPVDREMFEDLVRFKMNRLRVLVREILERWNETNPGTFIEKARSGAHEDAENDAIELRQLLHEASKMERLLRESKPTHH